MRTRTEWESFGKAICKVLVSANVCNSYNTGSHGQSAMMMRNRRMLFI
jgi:hypothetical protein